MALLRQSVLVVTSLALFVAACGGDDDSAAPNDDGVVEVTMKDSRFDPTQIEVKAGEEVTFRFTNDGKLDHEAYIGTESEQDAHEDEMRSGDSEDMSDMSHSDGSHGADREITVAPGESGELTYMFDEKGSVLIGCHEPGHYPGGMKATIVAS